MASPVEVEGLTKQFDQVTAVRDMSFSVRPGRVTGFLGPNGSGKTTTLRMLLGLVRPTSGTATLFGQRYARIPQPPRTVGSCLEATNFHPGRSVEDHLRVYGRIIGCPRSRVDEVVGMLDMGGFRDRKAGALSTGMRQRLNLATALLGDPRVLILDEPSNGLDPEGIAWLRRFLRSLAEEGRTVLVSSHVLGEAERMVDDVIIVNKGSLVHSGELAEFTEQYGDLEEAFLHMTGGMA